MASAGVGSAPHIFGEMFQRMAGIQLSHVPYRGNPIPDVISGQVDCLSAPCSRRWNSSGPASYARSG